MKRGNLIIAGLLIAVLFSFGVYSAEETAQAKGGRGFVSVLDFGAVGDGVADDPSVLAVLANGGDYRRIRDTVDRWLLGATLAREHGNITRAARSLGMSRKDLRARWNRVRG